MGDNYSGQYEYTDLPDPLDDFLAKLLADTPDLLPAPLTTPSPQSQPSTSASGPIPASHHVSIPPLACQWVSSHHLPLVCGATLSSDPKIACTHFRHAHDVRGNEKVIVSCRWRDCQAAPMQRGSLIRHILSVHLNLLRWRCELCGKMFSRRGTVHACADAVEGE